MADLNQAKLLSASSLENGRGIALTGNAQVVHVAVNNTTEWDVITLFVNHANTGSHICEINWAGTLFNVAVGSNEMIVALDRWRLNSGLEVKVRQASGTLGDMRVYLTVDRYPAG